jgi:hypothetical protein
MEVVIEMRVLGSRFWLQGADGEALRSEGRMQNAECRMRSLTTDHRIDADGNEGGDSRGRSPSLSVESASAVVTFCGIRIADCGLPKR